MSGVVEAENVSQRYGRRLVINELSLTVPEGITVLLGPNGAGKTTLLEMIATLRMPANGSLSVLGLNVIRRADLLQIRRRTGFLPQFFGFPAGFTTLEFLEYCGWLKKVPSGDLATAATRAAKLVHLTSVADRPLRSLSGGMRRRVGIAQALVHEPDLVILDEPAVGLDPQQRMQFRATVRDLASQRSFLISTHLVEDVEHLAAQVIVLAEGRVAFHGTPNELTVLGRADAPGDSPLERGYSTVLEKMGAGG